MRIFLLAAFFANQLASATESPTIDFTDLTNPVLQYENKSVKDYAVAYHNDHWYIYMSSFHKSRGEVRSHLFGVKTKDFKEFSAPLFLADGKQDGWKGLASPDITFTNQQWVMTFNSWGDKKDQPNQLFYMTSQDLETWSKPAPLAANVTKGVRAIDVAIRQQGERIYLVWKENQTPMIAVGSNLNGTFTRLGKLRFWLEDGTQVKKFENYQFVERNNQIYLLATAQRNSHLPTLFSLSDNPDVDQSWLRWVNGQTIEIEKQSFNDFERANASCLTVNPDAKGQYYLFYAGTNQGSEDNFAGRAWNRLGIARSQTLSTWESIPEKVRDYEFQRCSSLLNLRRNCRINLINFQQVYLVENLSTNSCVRDKTWGFENDSIWVDEGCRGLFFIEGKAG